MIALLVAAGLALAQMPPQPKWELTPSPMQRDLGELCLPSSLRVTVRSEPRQPVVAATIVLDAGPTTDAPGKEGAGRLLERLWFRSTVDGKGSARDRLQAMGARWNTHRTADTVVFAAQVGADRLPDLLGVQGTRFTDFLATVPDEVLAAEREALALALVGGEGLGDAELAAAFPTGFHAGGLVRTGALPTPASVRALTRDDLRAAAALWKPGGGTMLLAGDVDMERATRALETAFPRDALLVAPDGSEPSRGVCKPAERAKLAEPPVRSGKPVATAATGPVHEPVLLLGWSLPAGYDASDPVARVAAKFQWRRLVTGFLSESVARVVRYQPDCRYLPGAQASAYVCAVRLPQGTKPAALAQKVLDSLATTNLLPTAEDGEIDVWRIGDAQELSLGIGELPMIAGPAALREALELHHRHSPVWYGAATQATVAANVDAVKLFLSKWLANKLVQLHVVVPPGTDPATVTAWTGKPDMSGLEGERNRPAARLDAWELPLSDVGEAVLGPDAAPLPAPVLAGAREVRLPGGVRLVVLPYGEMPTVHVAAIATTPDDTAPVVGLGDWLWEVFRPVVDTLPGENQNYARLGMRVETRFSIDGAPSARTIAFDTSAGHLDPALWMLRHVVEYAEVHSSSDVRAERRYAAEDAWTQGASEPAEAARRARGTALFGAEHPITLGPTGRILWGSKASDKIAKARFAHTWSGPGLTVVVLGKVDPEDAVKRATAMFQTLATRKGADPGVPAAVAVQGADGLLRQGFDAPEAQATELTFACPVDGAASAEVREVGQEALARLVARALAGVTRDGPLHRQADRWGAAGLAELRTLVAPAQGAAAADALAHLQGSLAAAVDAALVAGAADTVARREVLGWGEVAEAVDRLAAYGPGAAEVAAARPARLAAVSSAEVGAWLAPCTKRAALTLVGPGAAQAAGK